LKATVIKIIISIFYNHNNLIFFIFYLYLPFSSFFIQIAVVESKLVEAINLLSGENAIERTVLEWTSSSNISHFHWSLSSLEYIQTFLSAPQLQIKRPFEFHLACHTLSLCAIFFFYKKKKKKILKKKKKKKKLKKKK